MSKRPPEMVEIHYRSCGPWGESWPEDDPDGECVYPDRADAAIRSLRVKLFRERARLWKERALGTWFTSALPALRRAKRFSRIAEAIERGER